VINILSAEVPKIQAHRFREAIQLHGRLPELDSVGGRDVGVEGQIAQTATKLCFTHTAVAEEQSLDLRVDSLATLKVLVVGAYFTQDVFARLFAADFRGQIIQLAAKKPEFFQRGQGFERSKPAKAETVIQAELTERGESGQRGKVAAEPPALG
jgi:hypothetical protein